MFSRSDGATALRTDLVRALSFSIQQCELETPGGGKEPAVAALAGVWNGRKGFVAIIVYRVVSQCVERYVCADVIVNERDLMGAVEEGLGFAESLGFGMDPPEFAELDVEQREQRLLLWNKLRKPRPGIAPVGTVRAADPVVPAPETDAGHRAVEPAPAAPPPDPLPCAQEVSAVHPHLGDIDPLATVTGLTPPSADELPVPAAASAASDGRLVLGRIELVRRDPEQMRTDPLARLLSHL